MGGFVNPNEKALGGGSTEASPLAGAKSRLADALRRAGGMPGAGTPIATMPDHIFTGAAPEAEAATVGTEEAAAVAEGATDTPRQRKTLANSGKARAAKGANGEREVLAALRMTMENVEAEMSEAGILVVGRSEFVTRKRIERKKSSEDIGGLPIISVEVKRQENLNVKGAWEQAVRQADNGRLPCLVYKYNREPWRVRTWLAATDPDGLVVGYYVGEIALPDFLAYYAKLYRRFLERQSQ